mmetsp:Transcript_50930/g.45724  ORF Transcript_50930/g.45724 Transcript_50930/m.45724 type:complete len:300 (-) Transcript_50930:188-1087(-)
MKLISSLIASCLAFTYAQNDTTTSEPTTTDMSTTQMYSTEPTIPFEKVIPVGDDPTDNLEECDYEWTGELTTEDIEITICGYTVDEPVEDGEEDETEEVEYVAISLDIPSTRWVALGIKTGDLDSSGGYDNYAGYNIIIPIKSNDIQEIYYDTDKSMEELDSSITIYSDRITSELRRVTRLVRPKTVGYEHLNNTIDNLKNAETDKLYFDFSDFDTCGDSVVISVQYGSMDNSKYMYSGYDEMTAGDDTYDEYREAVTENLEKVDGTECGSSGGEESIDDASHIVVFGAFIIGFIAMLF